MRMRHIFICALYDSTFPQYLINGKIFEKKKLLNTNCVFWFYNTTYVWNISHFKKNWSFFFILIEDIAHVSILTIKQIIYYAKNTTTVYDIGILLWQHVFGLPLDHLQTNVLKHWMYLLLKNVGLNLA